MKLKNTPWKYEAHADGTCEIYATDKRRETGLRWIGAAIDESTAHAIAALPETLAELERHKKLQQGMLDTITDREARVKELEENANNLINAIHEGDFMSMALLCETLKQVLEK